MSQAIITRYLPPTNERDSRIKATCYAGSITVPYSYDCEMETAHARAAQALCAKLGWVRTGWTGGGLADSTGYAFTDKGSRISF